MATSTASRLATERLHRLAGAELDDEDLRREAVRTLRRVLPVDAWSWATSDPATGLAATALAELPVERRMFALLEIEEDPNEVNRRSALVESKVRAAVLSATTGGRLERSRRWAEEMADHAIGDELRVIFADSSGCWGYLDLYTLGRRHYSDDDLALATEVAVLLTPALKRAAARDRGATASTAPGPARDPAVLILDPHLRVVAKTGPAAQWLPLLRTAAVDALPCAVLTATARALHSEAPAFVRQRDAEGRWATVRAARLDTGDVAVTVDHSRPAEVLGYVARAAGLSRRERELLDLLYEGYDTRSAAARLHIAETTVQDHTKRILAKTGSTSRRALLSSLSPPIANA